MKTAILLIILLLPMAGVAQGYHREIVSTEGGDSVIYVKDIPCIKVNSINMMFGRNVPEGTIILVWGKGDTYERYIILKPCTPDYTIKRLLDEIPPQAKPYWMYMEKNVPISISTPKTTHNYFAESLSVLWHEYRTECEHDSDKSRGAMMINNFPEFMKWIDKLNKK